MSNIKNLMSNPFQELNDKMDIVLQRLASFENVKHTPSRIPLKDFCEQRQISRPTVYAWNQRGLIQLEKIGGRQFVKSDSVTITEKYQRA